MAATRKRARAGAADHIGEDLQRLRADIVRLTEDVGTSLSVASNDQIRRIKDSIDALVSDVGERGREATEAVRDATHDFAETVEESVRARPLTTIAIAIGVGVLFGMTLRR
jgi:ElaB/YqjD/DUF883 family membrane-anchored ribosome-binding protein